jgi:hypothetical protein
VSWQVLLKRIQRHLQKWKSRVLCWTSRSEKWKSRVLCWTSRSEKWKYRDVGKLVEARNENTESVGELVEAKNENTEPLVNWSNREMKMPSLCWTSQICYLNLLYFIGLFNIRIAAFIFDLRLKFCIGFKLSVQVCSSYMYGKLPAQRHMQHMSVLAANLKAGLT